jgi:hypothetical protein
MTFDDRVTVTLLTSPCDSIFKSEDKSSGINSFFFNSNYHFQSFISFFQIWPI